MHALLKFGKVRLGGGPTAAESAVVATQVDALVERCSDHCACRARLARAAVVKHLDVHAIQIAVLQSALVGPDVGVRAAALGRALTRPRHDAAVAVCVGLEAHQADAASGAGVGCQVTRQQPMISWSWSCTHNGQVHCKQ